MKIGIDNALGVHANALMLRAERTEVLARNIANADTPGYKARDIDFHAVLAAQTKAAQANTANVETTHSRHLSTEIGSLSEADLQYRMPLMPTLDGNTVEAQVEQAAFAENSLQYMASLRFVNGKFSGMMTAIKGE